MNEVIESIYPNGNTYVDVEVSTAIVEKWVSESPLLAHYVSSGYFEGYRAGELSDVMVDTLHEYMNWFILRRVLWSLGFVIVAAVVVIQTMRKGQTKELQQKIAESSSTMEF